MDESHPSDAVSRGYDELPYPSATYPYSHCEHLALVARLFGIAATSVERCRVLEVGCADGANLIPMALALPRSQFVGIDLSGRQVAAGRALVARLGLTNIDLRQQDLSVLAGDVSGAIEEFPFDYIIAHGVYSWTSHQVQGELLTLIRSLLAPYGVAFVSYNVYPGWQQQKALREWLREAIRSQPGTTARLQRARRLVAGLKHLLAEQSDASHRGLSDMLTRLESWSDGYLRHDLLEDSNEPLYFADFVERIAAAGLRFFAEADVASMAGTGLPPELARGAQQLGGSLTGREQLLDLLTNRAFRQSLLCHAECPVREQLDAAAIRAAYVVSTLRAESPGDRVEPAGGPVRFASRSGFAVEAQDPMTAAALWHLQRAWPAGAWFSDLVAATGGNVVAGGGMWDDGPRRAQEEALANVLLAAFVERAVTLHTVDPKLTSTVGDRPVASPLARLQAQSGNLVTNLRHDVVPLDPLARVLIQKLDGRHDRPALAQLMTASDKPAEQRVAEILHRLHQSGLLTG